MVRFDIFAPIREFGAHKKILEKLDYPLTWVEGNACFQNRIAGIQVYALSGTLVKTMFLDDKPIARVPDAFIKKPDSELIPTFRLFKQLGPP